MITTQQIFDAAWQKFIIEDAPPASNPNGGCSYLTSDGRKCAVGLCLPDGHKAQESGLFMNELVDNYPELFDPHIETDIQNLLHDYLVNTNNGEWLYPLKKRMEIYLRVAEQFNLAIPAAKPTQ